MGSRNIECRKFSPNIFNKSKCTHCFRQREEHSAAALECNRHFEFKALKDRRPGWHSGSRMDGFRAPRASRLVRPSSRKLTAEESSVCEGLFWAKISLEHIITSEQMSPQGVL
uniref:Uncharacterized protein n=1 Tax=Anopheles farauti TaxID=69004 RepID=A0A182Q3D1_9DIPT